MGRAARTRAKETRAKVKRARKQANAAQYASWAREGINFKGSRSEKKSRNRNPLKGQHSFRPCGNLPCTKCYGDVFHTTGNIGVVITPRQFQKIAKRRTNPTNPHLLKVA